MKLPKTILIEKACSGDASRPVLNAVYLETLTNQPHPARLIATNGVIAAIVPVLIDENDRTGYITPETLKCARAADKKSHDAYLVANGACKLSNGMEITRPDLGKYPDVDQVIPKGETKFTVSLDPFLLLAVAQAIGSERGVSLEISAEGAAIRVRPKLNPRALNQRGVNMGFEPAAPEALGLIMPIAAPSKR